jgi:cell division protein FtsB
MQAFAAVQTRVHAWRGQLTMLAILLLAIYFVTAFAGQALRARELRADIAEHQATLAQIETENRQLQTQVDRFATDSYFTYVAQRARRDLLLANSGETLVLIDWTAPAATAPPAEDQPLPNDEPNWKRWLEAFDRR